MRAMPSARAGRASTEPQSAVRLGHSATIAIAGVCEELLARQAERNIRILKGDE